MKCPTCNAPQRGMHPAVPGMGHLGPFVEVCYDVYHYSAPLWQDTPDASAPHAVRVAVDFDGVLSAYRSWRGITELDPPEEGAREFVLGLVSDGYDVVVMSSRARYADGYRAIVKWLSDNDFPPLQVTHEKVLACAYVDDRAIHYAPGSGSWADATQRVKELSNHASSTDVLKEEHDIDVWQVDTGRWLARCNTHSAGPFVHSTEADANAWVAQHIQ